MLRPAILSAIGCQDSEREQFIFRPASIETSSEFCLAGSEAGCKNLLGKAESSGRDTKVQGVGIIVRRARSEKFAPPVPRLRLQQR